MTHTDRTADYVWRSDGMQWVRLFAGRMVFVVPEVHSV